MWWEEQTYLQAYAGLGYNQYSTTRNIHIPGFVQSQVHGAQNDPLGTNTGSRSAKGDTNGIETNFAISGGYDVRLGNLRVGPTVGLYYDYVNIGSFQESGANSLNLQVQEQNVHSLRTLMGARLDYTMPIDTSTSFTPYVSVRWRHELANDGHAIRSNFAGNPTFQVRNEPSRNSALINVGFNIETRGGVNIYVDYQGDVGRSNYGSHSVLGGFRIRF